MIILIQHDYYNIVMIILIHHGYYNIAVIILIQHEAIIQLLLSLPGEGNGSPTTTLAWRIPWTEEPGKATVRGIKKSRTRVKCLTPYLYRGKKSVPRKEEIL